jgi:hypothetical protein
MKSWKTTLGGALNALGLALVAIEPNNVIWRDLGLVIAALGAFVNGIYGRDHNVSSESAGCAHGPV